MEIEQSSYSHLNFKESSEIYEIHYLSKNNCQITIFFLTIEFDCKNSH